MPFFLTTREFFEIARDHLTAGGVLANNAIGQESGPKSKFFRSVFRTMKAVLPNCQAYRVAESGPAEYNFEIFAVNASLPVPIQTVRQRAAKNTLIKDPQLAKRVETYVRAGNYRDVPLLTDDYAPTDQLLHLW